MRYLDVTHLAPFPSCAPAADNSRMDPQGFNTNSRLRASDADRDRAASVLNEALAEGRLTPEEHSERLDSICAAKTLADWEPDGMTTYLDAGMVALARVAEKLGLPFHSPATAAALTDKARQRRALADAGLDIPPCYLVRPNQSEPELAAVEAEVGWPAVLKPRSAQGSRCTFLARDGAELEKLLDQRAGNLSGGEQQMLALGRVMMTQPRLLMIDELALGLAPMTTERLMGIVRAVHAKGTTVILVEQSVNRAMSLAERAIFLERGEIRFDGLTADLLNRNDLLRPVFLSAASVEG